ncbi:olfactory receptor 52B2-like [Microcaecilia unicolor]|uniref:Olfactory receptor 52B2-like n=1 Tax=Microcaecilia unicolor TaxID=1415580 RepID=A0A6P7XR70_9AMPH|nr:olfactory receptor 52B2-like [Microcaecilia unicolor]
MMGNSILIYVICREENLHSPMYILMSLLCAVHICNVNTIIPRMLLGLAFHLNQISLNACLTQMFLIYFGITLWSNILLVMALDRYVAICKPLRYLEIVNKTLLSHLAAAGLLRSGCVVLPIVLLASQVRFCGSNIIRNFVCENMALLLLACSDISRIKTLGMLMRALIVFMDIGLILVSYTLILRAALRISSGSIRNKALHTCGTQLLIVFVGYFCALLSSIVYRAGKSVSQDVHNLLSGIYFILPATVDPIIYGVRVKGIRQCIQKLLRTRVAIKDS